MAESGRTVTCSHFTSDIPVVFIAFVAAGTYNVDLGHLVNQLIGRGQQQYHGCEAVKLWAEIWNFTRETWSGIPDFCS